MKPGSVRIAGGAPATGAALGLGAALPAVVLSAFVLSACGGEPLGAGESGPVRTSVSVSLADVTTSAGLPLCGEADLARLTVRQGTSVRVEEAAPGPASDCIAEFSVPLVRGPVEFTGLLFGNDRPLMSGRVERVADRDLDVTIRLAEIEALRVETRTTGFGGPPSYAFAVDDGAAVPIGTEDTEIVGALAAGERVVRLAAGICAVANERVGITTDSADVALAAFDVDCSEPGSVLLQVRSVGSGGPPLYQLELRQTDPTPAPYEDARSPAPNADELFFEIPPGHYQIALDVGPCLSITPRADLRFFLEAGGFVERELFVVCGGAGALEIVTNTITSPGSANPTGYQVQVDGGTPLPVAANHVMTVNVAPGTHTVDLRGVSAFPGCTLVSPNPVTASVGAGLTVTVRFDVVCAPTQAPAGIRIVTKTSGSPQVPQYTATVTPSLSPAVTVSVGANDSIDVVPLSPANNPHVVHLSPGPGCFIPAGATVSVIVPSAGLTRVPFRVDCF